MKAVIYEQYGAPEVLRLREIAQPVPKDHEILVRVRATTVTVGDTIMRSLRIPGPPWQRPLMRLYLGVFRPRRKILGMELAGDIEAVGGRVTSFQVGEAVMASTFGVGFGGYAEYRCLPADGMLVRKPEALSYAAAAAAVGGGMTAFGVLARAGIQPGQRVLIYGASGAVGTSAVQIAKRHFGAEVTGVCSTGNVGLVKSLGADHVIDYSQEDFAESGQRYEVVFDAVGKAPAEKARQVLKPGGVYRHVIKDTGGKEKKADLLAVQALAEAGQFRPPIDRSYPLADIVAAHRYVDQGHKKGHVAIVAAPSG